MTTETLTKARDALEEFAGGSPRTFEIPEWVPTSIAKHARERVNDPLIERLTTDPRMEAVWAHLTRRERKTGLLAQPARWKSFATITDPAKLQDIAMLVLFCFVLDAAQCRPRAVLQREVEDTRRERAALSRKLWAEAQRLEYLEETVEGTPRGHAGILYQACFIMLKMSIQDDPDPGVIVVERDRRKLEERGTAIAIAGQCFYLFGAPLYKLSAIMTTIALGREVTPRDVREWWADRPIYAERG